MDRATVLTMASLLGFLGGAALGYAFHGVEGAAIAGVAFALAVGVVPALLLVANALGGKPLDPSPWDALPAVLPLLALLAVSNYVPRVERVLSLELVAGTLLAVGLALGVVRGRFRRGLWQGIVAGGATGVAFVFVSIHRSFTMRPALGGVVLASGIVAPLIGGVLVGAGGALGGLAGRFGGRGSTDGTDRAD